MPVGLVAGSNRLAPSVSPGASSRKNRYKRTAPVVRSGGVASRHRSDLPAHLRDVCRSSPLYEAVRRPRAPGPLPRERELRLTQESFLPAALDASGRLQVGITPAEILAVIWALTGSDTYSMLVFERGWTPSRYEEWLGATLISLLLKPRQL